jgi:peptide/nickel transport system substrate-binding protein
MPTYFKKAVALIKKILNCFKNLALRVKDYLLSKGQGLKKTQLNLLKQKDLDKKLVFSIRQKFDLPKILQFKMLPVVLSVKEKKTIKLLIALSLISFLFLGWRFYTAHLKIVPGQGGDYTEGVIGGPKYINPILSQTADIDMDLSRLIFSGLLKYDAQQKIVGDLAEKNELSSDQKNYTLWLKKNIHWQDDEKLNAEDVIFTFQSIKNPNFKSPLSVNFQGVEIEKINDQTVKFKLTEPYAPFLSLLTFGILPRHIWEDIEPATAGLADYNLISPLGSGPFQAKVFNRDKSGKIKSYTLERNENYYDQKPYLDKITFVFFDAKDDALLALKNKTIEGLSFLTFEQKEELAKKESLNFYTLKIPQYTALFINQKNDLLKNKNFRQALAYSLDKEKIVSQNLAGNAELINGPILPDFVGYKEDLKTYEYDPAKTKKTIESLGWQKLKPEDKFYKKKENKEERELKLTLTIINKELNQHLAQVIKNYWEDVGIKVEIKPIEPTEAQEKIFRAHDYEILLYGENLGLDADLYPFWHSSQIAASGFNLSQFANKEADKILEEARATTDLKARHDKYVYFQNILTEEIPAIFLYRPIYYYAVDKKIKGLNLDNIYIANSSDRFNGIENWYIKTKKKLKLGE